jgi:hypothetical protein
MINARYLSQSCDVGPVVVRALSSLTNHHARQIAEAVQAAAPDWAIDPLDDYDGYLSVLVSMPDETEGQPSYLISGTVQQIELSEVQGDTMRKVGRFENLDQAVDVLIARLSPKPVF